MPTILNFGSCCIDNVYQVPRFVSPGETLPCSDYQIHAGGKGLNQSVALAHAGANVMHAGRLGKDGIWMISLLQEAGVDTSGIEIVDIPCGHAIIQVTPNGDNAIVIYGGANKSLVLENITKPLAQTRDGDFLLIQNEMNLTGELIERASHKGLRIVFNAAPITEEVFSYPLDKIEVFIVNEFEAQALTGESEPEGALDVMLQKFPEARTVLTLGGLGAVYADRQSRLQYPAFDVKALDSTGAGDTFTGYFLAAFAEGKSIEYCLSNACKAAALCVTRPGAAASIPRLHSVERTQLKIRTTLTLVN